MEGRWGGGVRKAAKGLLRRQPENLAAWAAYARAEAAGGDWAAARAAVEAAARLVGGLTPTGRRGWPVICRLAVELYMLPPPAAAAAALPGAEARRSAALVAAAAAVEPSLAAGLVQPPPDGPARPPATMLARARRLYAAALTEVHVSPGLSAELGSRESASIVRVHPSSGLRPSRSLLRLFCPVWLLSDS